MAIYFTYLSACSKRARENGKNQWEEFFDSIFAKQQRKSEEKSSPRRELNFHTPANDFHTPLAVLNSK
jgi:hypothetical protein